MNKGRAFHHVGLDAIGDGVARSRDHKLVHAFAAPLASRSTGQSSGLLRAVGALAVSNRFDLLTGDEAASIGVCDALLDFGELFSPERNMRAEGLLGELRSVLAGCLGELLDLRRRLLQETELQDGCFWGVRVQVPLLAVGLLSVVCAALSTIAPSSQRGQGAGRQLLMKFDEIIGNLPWRPA